MCAHITWEEGYDGSVLGTLLFYGDIVTWKLSLPNERSNNQKLQNFTSGLHSHYI